MFNVWIYELLISKLEMFKYVLGYLYFKKKKNTYSNISSLEIKSS